MRAAPTATVNAVRFTSNAGSATMTVQTAYGGYFSFASVGAGDSYILAAAYNLLADL